MTSFLIGKEMIDAVSNQYEFHCVYCGKEFGDDVIELARHIGREHDPTRN